MYPCAKQERSTTMKAATFLTAMEIANILGVSRSTGYKIVSILNNELKDKGFIIVPGRVSKKYFSERFYDDISSNESVNV